MSGRGMKKWRPFSSLEEQKPSLQQMKYQKGKCPKPQISHDQAEKSTDISMITKASVFKLPSMKMAMF